MKYLVLLLVGLVLAGCNNPQKFTDAQIDQMVGQMVMVGFRGTKIVESDAIARDISAGRVGGVILFNRDVARKSNVRNIVSPQQLKGLVTTLQKYASTPLFIAIDQEGGKVARLNPSNGFDKGPSAQGLGKRDNLELTEYAGCVTGKSLAKMGINLNLAPVVDVNINPNNPAIGKLGRSFSADPQKVTAHASAYLAGLHKSHVLGCLKHFPGHGSAFNDSHHGITDVTETARLQELIPFQKIIASRNCDMIMTAHIFNANLDADYPATLSKKTITGLLRDKMKYNGVVISDDLQMAAITNQYGLETAVINAINAGVDILLFGNNIKYDKDLPIKVNNIIRQAIAEEKINKKTIIKSNQRIKNLKKQF